MLRRLKNKLLTTDSVRNIHTILSEHSALIGSLGSDTVELTRKIDSQRSSVLQLDKGRVIAKIFNGQKIYLDTSDISVVPHLCLDGIWEPDITKAWLNIVKPNSTVFDIGANFGYYGLIASQVLDLKKSKVIYFEPNPDLVQCIKKTLGINWLVQCSQVEPVAVSDKEGSAELTILEDYIGSSSLHSLEELKGHLDDSMYLGVHEKLAIKTVRIDDYCQQNGIKSIDLVKLDVEGYEDAAFRGMQEIIKSSPDLVMFLEFTPAGYKDPKGFYASLGKSFKHIYTINNDGSLKNISTAKYEDVAKMSEDWIMLVLSKKVI